MHQVSLVVVNYQRNVKALYQPVPLCNIVFTFNTQLVEHQGRYDVLQMVSAVTSVGKFNHGHVVKILTLTYLSWKRNA